MYDVYHGYVAGIISSQVIQEGGPHLVSTVPFRTDTAVHVFFFTRGSFFWFSFSSIETLFVACIDHGLDFIKK